MRGKSSPEPTDWWAFNLRQVGLVLMTLISLAILVVAVGGGLLGYPEMFILGNGSYGNYLNWFEPRIESTLPAVQVISISVWFYRLLILCWALWLSFALIRWLTEGWKYFSHGGTWRHQPEVEMIDAEVVPEPSQ